MPTYTYTCTSCAATVDKRQSFSDAPLTTCEVCGGALRKVIYPVGILFKGSGWYSTDSRKSTSSAVDGNGETKSDGDGQAAASPKDSKDAKNAKKESADTKAEAKADSTASSASATPAPTKPTPKE